MINQLRYYLNKEFANFSETKELIDYKEELFANLLEKYQDYLNMGYNEEKAYTETIKSIGNLSELTLAYQKNVSHIQTAIIQYKRSIILFLGISIIGILIHIIINTLVGIPLIGVIVQYILIVVGWLLLSLSYISFKQLNDSPEKEKALKLGAKCAGFVVIYSSSFVIPYFFEDYSGFGVWLGLLIFFILFSLLYNLYIDYYFIKEKENRHKTYNISYFIIQYTLPLILFLMIIFINKNNFNNFFFYTMLFLIIIDIIKLFQYPLLSILRILSSLASILFLINEFHSQSNLYYIILLSSLIIYLLILLFLLFRNWNKNKKKSIQIISSISYVYGLFLIIGTSFTGSYDSLGNNPDNWIDFSLSSRMYSTWVSNHNWMIFIILMLTTDIFSKMVKIKIR